MKKLNHCLPAVILLPVLTVASCKKTFDLNAIPNSNWQTITSLQDAQALLDNTFVMRETPSLGELSADNFYISADVDVQSMDPVEFNAYCWKADIFQGRASAEDWFLPYRQVFYANSILEALPKISTTNTEQLTRIEGACYFIRAYAFFNIATQFANLYSANADIDPGIPLRLTADPEASYPRASVRATYDRILKDVQQSSSLLMQVVDPNKKNRPSRPAAFALLARVYLAMGNFHKARDYADSTLSLFSELLDYNDITNSTTNPFDANNKEVLYQTNLRSRTDLFHRSFCYVDSTLYSLYADQDLRKDLYFKIGDSGKPVIRFSYSGDATKFSGLAVDEILLIRAECYARLGNTSGAVQDIVTLLKKRYKDGQYSPPTISSPAEAVELVLSERRKELVYRGLRWLDIRRLNSIIPSINLTRIINNQRYDLTAQDKRFVLPIPPDVIEINTGMVQNPRN